MLLKILNIITSDIVVDVSPDRFVFERSGVSKTIKTKIYLSNDQKKPKILGVGEEIAITQPNICIELFKCNKDDLLLNNSKSQFLDAFFKHAIYLMSKKTAMIRPRVVIKNSKSLCDLLCGYQELILYQSAANGGARECVFES